MVWEVTSMLKPDVGWVIITDSSFEAQPFASVAITVYVPAPNPVKFWVVAYATVFFFQAYV